jgi:hypothetical protein
LLWRIAISYIATVVPFITHKRRPSLRLDVPLAERCALIDEENANYAITWTC